MVRALTLFLVVSCKNVAAPFPTLPEADTDTDTDTDTDADTDTDTDADTDADADTDVEPCVDDAMEPNDSRADARPLPADGTALVVGVGAADNWSVVVPARTRQQWDVTFDHEIHDVDVRVWGADGEVMATGTSTSDNERVDFANFGSDPVTVVLDVALYQPLVGGCNTYSVVSSSTPLDACTVDTLEPNDLVGEEYLLEGDHAGLTVDPSDPDLFQVAVPAGSAYVGRFEEQGGEGDLEARLLDAGGGEIAFDGIGASYDLSAVNTTGQPTVYTVRITSDGDCVLYDLEHDVVEPASCVTDALEPNDAAGAPAIDGLYAGLSVGPSDPDVHTVVVPAGAAFRGFLVTDGLFGTPTLTLSNGSTVVDTDAVEPFDVQWVNPTTSDVALTLEVVSSVCMDYALDVGSVEEATCTQPDAREGGSGDDTYATAIPAPASSGTATGLNVTPVDLDYASFSIPAGHLLTVDVETDGQFAEPVLRLFDADPATGGATVDTDTFGPLFDVAELNLTGEDGTYTLEIVPDGCMDYDLVWSLTDCRSPDDDTEPNETALTAWSAGEATDRIVTGASRDHFAIPTTVAAGGSITVDLSFDHTRGNVNGALLDGSGAELSGQLGGSSFSDGERLTWVNQGSSGVDVVLQVVMSGSEPCDPANPLRNTYDFTAVVN